MFVSGAIRCFKIRKGQSFGHLLCNLLFYGRPPIRACLTSLLRKNQQLVEEVKDCLWAFGINLNLATMLVDEEYRNFIQISIPSSLRTIQPFLEDARKFVRSDITFFSWRYILMLVLFLSL